MVFSSRFPAFLAAGLMALAFSFPAEAVRVKGELVKPVAKSAPLALRSGNYPNEATSRLGFKELSVERIVEVQKRNKINANFKAVQVGIARLTQEEGSRNELPALKWQVLKTGKVTRIEVTSPDALSTRVGLRIGVLDNRAELRFFGSGNPNKIEAVVRAVNAKQLIDQNNLYWTPVTEGEKQTIEIFMPLNAAARDVRINIDSVMHLLVTPRDNLNLAKAFGESGSCEVNVICSVATLGQNFVNAKNSVARMIFTKPSGTFTCTGTLLNDNVAASQIPYFYTANHCISTQSVANTLVTFWNDESATCANSAQPSPTQLSGGANLHYTQSGGSVGSDSGTDATFLSLKTTPPAGAFFAGWDSSALANSTAMTAIHHPSGDMKKVSQGTKYSSGTNTHFLTWSTGTTEGGSSGSGVFSFDSNGYYLRGGLFGGSASCANSGGSTGSGNSDIYSRFDVVYPNLTAWLTPAPTVGPTVSHTGPWYNAAESGWGLTWYDDYANNGFFGLMFIYTGTGTPDWYEFAGDWTGTNIHSGNLRQNTGPNFGTTFDPGQVVKTPVGTYTLTFTSATTATLTFTANGVTRTNIPLTKL